MDIRSIQDMILEIMNSKLLVILVFVLIIAFALKAIKQRGNKVKLLMEDDRFKNANFFVSDIKSPMAISQSGYVGVAMENFTVPFVMHIKDLKKMTLISDIFKIAESDEEDPGGLLFGDIQTKAGFALKQKQKEIILVLTDAHGSVLSIPLFVSTLRKAVVPGVRQQNAMKQLLGKLEEVEKSARNN